MLNSTIPETTPDLLHALARILHNQDCFVQRDIQELTVLQLNAVKLIKKQEKIAMGELAEALKITPASTTALVDRLLRTGWVVRNHSPEDRRQIYLTLAPDRASQLAAILKLKYRDLERALKELPEADRQSLHKTLTHLISSLNSTISHA